MKKANFNSKGSINLTRRNVPDVSHITSRKSRPTWKSKPQAKLSNTGTVILKEKSIPNVSSIINKSSGKAKLSSTGTVKLKSPYRRKHKAKFNSVGTVNLTNRIVPDVSSIIANHSGKASFKNRPRSKRKRQEAKAQQIANATGIPTETVLNNIKSNNRITFGNKTGIEKIQSVINKQNEKLALRQALEAEVQSENNKLQRDKEFLINMLTNSVNAIPDCLISKFKEAVAGATRSEMDYILEHMLAEEDDDWKAFYRRHYEGEKDVDTYSSLAEVEDMMEEIVEYLSEKFEC